MTSARMPNRTVTPPMGNEITSLSSITASGMMWTFVFGVGGWGVGGGGGGVRGVWMLVGFESGRCCCWRPGNKEEGLKTHQGERQDDAARECARNARDGRVRALECAQEDGGQAAEQRAGGDGEDGDDAEVQRAAFDEGGCVGGLKLSIFAAIA